MAAKILPAEAAAELLRRRAVRRSLAEFARSQGLEPAAHHLLLCDELEAVERGDNDFLIIEMPPGSAKSTWVNWLFPAWCLARRPKLPILTASHSSELAERWGRRTRNLVQSSSALLGMSVAGDSGAAFRWSTTNGGEYYAVGCGVGIMGFRAGGGILDDPYGSREDAESKRVRDSRWEWLQNDFNSRLQPGAWRVIMHQRFHEDDIVGRLVAQLDAIGRPYRRLKIRAEATDDDPLGRSPGEMLWDDPSGYNYGQFLRDRKLECDARTWSALYQQEPMPDSGDYFRREWLVPVEKLPPRDTLRLYGASDYAVTSDGGDYTVHVVIGLDPDGNMYLVDLWRRQAASDEWVEAWCDLVKKWRPLEWAEETGQIKSGVGPFLERRARERQAYCVRSQFPTRGDKAVRAQSIRGRMASRGLRIPATAPWRADFESELLRFPAGVHDDQCLVEGTMIRMADGSARPIEGVSVGDFVATPIGPCEVLESRVTNDAATVFRVSTSCGRQIVATGNHPVHVEGKGFARVDALGIMDQITLEASCNAEHRKLRSSSIAGTVIGAIRTAATLRIGAIFMRQSLGVVSCIGTYGKTSAGRSLAGIISTTSMGTRRTTPSRTWLAFRAKTIAQSTLSMVIRMLGKSSIWSGFDRRLRNGTHPKMGENGILRTAGSLGKAASLFAKRVLHAASCSMLGSSEQSFALAHANNAVPAAAVRDGEDTSLQVRLSNANAAIGNSSANGLTMPCIARKPAGCVIAIEVLSEKARVRNLTVSRAHAYYANGFLVHNCDAIGLAGQLLDKMLVGAAPKPEDSAPKVGYSSRDRRGYDSSGLTL